MKKDTRQSGFGFGDFELFANESAGLVNPSVIKVGCADLDLFDDDGPAPAAETIEEIIKREREATAAREERDTFRGYKIADLRKRFDHMTAHLANWKAPFSVTNLLGEEVMPTVAAIGFFTGDDAPDVVLNVATMRYAIYTRGYYEATGGC